MSNGAIVAVEAHAVLTGDKSHDLYGNVYFSEADGKGPVRVHGTIHNLTEGLHGFHIHEFGNIVNGCEGAGSHFNPDGYSHGGLADLQRHAGDLGNIRADDQGIAIVNLVVNAFTLNGEFSVIGRAIVVHQDPDDLGRGNHSDSKSTGHSGSRVACGVIGVAAHQFIDGPN